MASKSSASVSKNSTAKRRPERILRVKTVRNPEALQIKILREEFLPEEQRKAAEETLPQEQRKRNPVRLQMTLRS